MVQDVKLASDSHIRADVLSDILARVRAGARAGYLAQNHYGVRTRDPAESASSQALQCGHGVGTMDHVRIAVMSDIHGNAPALASVLADVERHAVDRIYVLGDVINGGPEPEACWSLVQERADGIVRGNHERYVLAALADEPGFAGGTWGPAHWTAARLSPSALAEIAGLPHAIALEDWPPGGMGTLLCHASPRRDDDAIFPDTPNESVRPTLEGIDQGSVVRGHNHVAFEREVAGIRLIAIGAVGLSFGVGPGAEYAILDASSTGGSVEHRRVTYDVEATLAACRHTGYLDEAGPVARLFVAEIETGRPHLGPFMRRFNEPSEHESLGAAVERYLRG